ncbi:MAG: hypothetical protein RBT01_06350 [Anaerolineaceae bacterium]|jgi:hypothetical protein|nr:hypothetical protein [Anaerolineaceae bacterium]
MSDFKFPENPLHPIDWLAAFWSGLISGVAMLLLSIILPWIILGDPLFITRLMASILLGPQVMPLQSGLVPGIYVVALITHFSLSFFYAALIVLIFHRWGMLVAFVGGGIFGLIIYVINYFSFSIVFPWLRPYGNWMLLAANILFGALAGALYELFERPDINDQPFLLADSEKHSRPSALSDTGLTTKSEEL